MLKEKLHIKNMVCSCSIMVVKNELESLGVRVTEIELGYATILRPKEVSKAMIAARLQPFELELLPEQTTIMIEETKIAVLQYLQMPSPKKASKNLSQYIADEVGRNYNSLSKLFSKKEGKTIEQYYIQLKVEKVKEFLDYDELSSGQIAIKLGYSSVHHLSSQFKKVSGLSVTAFKKRLKTASLPTLRIPLDKL